MSPATSSGSCSAPASCLPRATPLQPARRPASSLDCDAPRGGLGPPALFPVGPARCKAHSRAESTVERPPRRTDVPVIPGPTGGKGGASRSPCSRARARRKRCGSHVQPGPRCCPHGDRTAPDTWGSCLDRGSAAGSPRAPHAAQTQGSKVCRCRAACPRAGPGACLSDLVNGRQALGSSGGARSRFFSSAPRGSLCGAVRGPAWNRAGHPLLQAGCPAWSAEPEPDLSLCLGQLPSAGPSLGAAVRPWARDSGALGRRVCVRGCCPG